MEKEFAKQMETAENLKNSFYFCKTYNLVERGASENANRLIRLLYINKGTDFNGIIDGVVI